MTEQVKELTAEDTATAEMLAANMNSIIKKYNAILSGTATEAEVKQMKSDAIIEARDFKLKLEESGKENATLKADLQKFMDVVKIQGESITTLKTAFDPKEKKTTFRDAVAKALEGGIFNKLEEKQASNASFKIELKDIAFGASGFTGGATYQAGAAIHAAMPFQLPVFTPEEDFDIRMAVPTGVSNNAKLDFPVERSWTDNMGCLLENGPSNESEVTFTMSSVTSQRMSTHITVSRSALRNVPWLSNHISTRLMGKFIKLLNTQVLTGVGTTVYMSGLVTNQTTFTAGGLAGTMPNANLIDVLISARARNYQVNKIKPNVVFVNPLDAVALTTYKSTIGEWANKEPFMTINSNGIMSVMGMAIVESFDITQGTYLMVNSSSQNFELLFNGPIEILATDSEASNFLANLVTIKLEAEVMFPIYRTGAIIGGTFVSDLAAIKGGI